MRSYGYICLRPHYFMCHLHCQMDSLRKSDDYALVFFQNARAQAILKPSMTTEDHWSFYVVDKIKHHFIPITTIHGDKDVITSAVEYQFGYSFKDKDLTVIDLKNNSQFNQIY